MKIEIKEVEKTLNNFRSQKEYKLFNSCLIKNIIQRLYSKELKESAFKVFKKPISTCYGITNKCEDGKYILFADYDKIYFSTLLKELDNVFKRNKKYLTQFAIFESTESILTKNGTFGSYHVVSFAKLPYQKMREILSFMTVDDDFFKLPKTVPYRANTLRISPKFDWEEQQDGKTGEPVGNQKVLKDAPKFVCWFPDINNIPEVKVSEGHLKTYKHLIKNFCYPFIFNEYKMDCSTKIELKQYDSLGA